MDTRSVKRNYRIQQWKAIMFLLRENYTTINLTPMFRMDTPLEQCAHTGPSVVLTPVGRNLQWKEAMKSIIIIFYAIMSTVSVNLQ